MPEPCHITFVVDTYPCLSETFIEREVQELRRQGVAVDVVALRGGAPHQLPSRPAGALRAAILLRYWHHPRYCLSLLRHAGQAAALAERARNIPNSHILAQFAWTPADVARMASERSGVPFSVRAHAWDVFAQSPESLRRRLDSATAVLPCSNAAADAVLGCGYAPASVRVVRHGLPLAEPSWDWSAPAETARIIGIGRLVPKKGVDVLLGACAALAQRGVPFSAEWIGDGPERPRLQQLAARLGLGGQVQFPGALPPDATRERLRGAALLALPSRRLPSGDRDGIANVLVEAMALGVPIVTTTAGAAPEVIVDGHNGLLVPPDDTAALANALRRCLDSATLRASLSRNARTTVERDFDLAANVAQLVLALRPR